MRFLRCKLYKRHVENFIVICFFKQMRHKHNINIYYDDTLKLKTILGLVKQIFHLCSNQIALATHSNFVHENALNCHSIFEFKFTYIHMYKHTYEYILYKRMYIHIILQLISIELRSNLRKKNTIDSIIYLIKIKRFKNYFIEIIYRLFEVE